MGRSAAHHDAKQLKYPISHPAVIKEIFAPEICQLLQGAHRVPLSSRAPCHESIAKFSMKGQDQISQGPRLLNETHQSVLDPVTASGNCPSKANGLALPAHAAEAADLSQAR